MTEGTFFAGLCRSCCQLPLFAKPRACGGTTSLAVLVATWQAILSLERVYMLVFRSLKEGPRKLMMMFGWLLSKADLHMQENEIEI
jgi:hypothetical protein